jgi:hypothetical protein
MNRNYLIERMKRTKGNIIDLVHCLPSAFELDKEQQELIEPIEFILLEAYKQIDDKIAEYSLKSANTGD